MKSTLRIYVRVIIELISSREKPIVRRLMGWIGGVSLLGAVLSLLLLSMALGMLSVSSERVLFIAPTLEVDALPSAAGLLLPNVRFEGWLRPTTGIDTPLWVSQVQPFVPGQPQAAAPQQWIAAYPTTPPLPPLVTAASADGREPYGGDGCAPRGVPAQGTLNQGFHAHHLGIDIGVQPGTPVKATHSGIVVYAAWSSIGYGYLVILQNSIFTTYYGHNQALHVLPGERVGRGSVLAASGSSGNSTGPHIHYEVRIHDLPVDPLTFEDATYTVC